MTFSFFVIALATYSGAVFSAFIHNLLIFTAILEPFLTSSEGLLSGSDG